MLRELIMIVFVDVSTRADSLFFFEFLNDNEPHFARRIALITVDVSQSTIETHYAEEFRDTPEAKFVERYAANKNRVFNECLALKSDFRLDQQHAYISDFGLVIYYTSISDIEEDEPNLV